jgi:hypothetical protein
MRTQGQGNVIRRIEDGVLLSPHIAGLRVLPATAGAWAVALCSATPGDGGGGLFYAAEEGEHEDDGEDTIVAASGGAWIRHPIPASSEGGEAETPPLADVLAEGNTSGGLGIDITGGASLRVFSGSDLSSASASVSGDVNNGYWNFSGGNAVHLQMRAVVFSESVASEADVSYVYGGQAIGGVRRDRYTIVVADATDTVRTAVYDVVCNGPVSGDGNYNDVLVPIVAPDAYSPALAISVALSGADNARQIDITNDALAAVTVSVYVESFGCEIAPTPAA